MFSDPIRIAGAINNPKFHPGEAVVLVEGPQKYVHGIFLGLQEDVEWGAIQESNGAVNSHPVEWMRSDRGPGSALSSPERETK